MLGNPNTRDAFDIQESINKINQGYIIINILSLSGATYLFQQVCQKTKGKFDVALNEHDFKLKLMVAAALLRATRRLLIEFQKSFHEYPVHRFFSSARFQRRSSPLLQYKPIDVVSNKSRKLAYECTRCKAFSSEMPSLCGVCKTPLISSMQIARSKQEKIDKLITKQFPRAMEEAPKDLQSPRSKKTMDMEGIPKARKGSVANPKIVCTACDSDIVKMNEDDYFAECSDCGSNFCR